MNELERIKILATANMKIAGVPALHKTLEQLLIDEKYEVLNVMNQVYENEKGGRVEAEVSKPLYKCTRCRSITTDDDKLRIKIIRRGIEVEEWACPKCRCRSFYKLDKDGKIDKAC